MSGKFSFKVLDLQPQHFVDKLLQGTRTWLGVCFCCGGFNESKKKDFDEAQAILFLCLLVSGANSRCFVIPIESSSCFERSTHVVVSRALDFILCQI